MTSILAFLRSLVTPEIRSSIAAFFHFEDNYLLRREWLRDTRRCETLKLAGIACTVLGVVITATLWLIFYLRSTGRLRHGIPAFMGGDLGTLVVALTSGIHAWFVIHAASRTSAFFFLREYRQNTLTSLLMLPCHPARTIALCTTYPFVQAMGIAFAGLPFYVLGLGISGPSLFDIAGIYLVFTMIAFSPPRWAAPALGGLMYNEATKRIRQSGPLTPTEALSRYMGIFGWAGMQVVLSTVGKGSVAKILLPLLTLIPKDMRRLAAPFPFTWPLVLGRWMFSPIPFYAFTLPPVIPILALYIIGRVLRIWSASFFLRVGDAKEIPLLTDHPAFRRLSRIHGWVLTWVLLGYVWKPYMASGLMSGWVWRSQSTLQHAQAGLVFILGWVLAWTIWFQCYAMRGKPPVSKKQKQATAGMTPIPEPVVTPRQRLLRICAAAWMSGSLYLAACLAAWANPFPLPVLEVCGKLGLVILAGSALFTATWPSVKLLVALILLPGFGWMLDNAGLGSLIAGLSPVAALASISEHLETMLHVAQPKAIVASPLVYAGTVAATAIVVAVIRLLQASKQRSLKSSDVSAAEQGVENEEEAVLPNRREYPAALAFISCVQRKFDNAVAIREMRVLLRGRMSRAELIAGGVILLLATALSLYGMPESAVIGSGIAVALYGQGITGVAAVLAGLVTLFSLGATFLCALAAAPRCAMTLPKEKDRSTLGFTLITPMPTSAIAAGKIIGLIAPTMLGAAVVSLWSLFLTLILCALINPVVAIKAWLIGSILPLPLIPIAGCFGLLASTFWRKENDASGCGAFLLMGMIGIAIAGVGYTVSLWSDIPPKTWVLVFLMVCVIFGGLLALLCWLWSNRRIERMRHGDVEFESAKGQA
jgi:hypothetical protein